MYKKLTRIIAQTLQLFARIYIYFTLYQLWAFTVNIKMVHSNHIFIIVMTSIH